MSTVNLSLLEATQAYLSSNGIGKVMGDMQSAWDVETEVAAGYISEHKKRHAVALIAANAYYDLVAGGVAMPTLPQVQQKVTEMVGKAMTGWIDHEGSARKLLKEDGKQDNAQFVTLDALALYHFADRSERMKAYLNSSGTLTDLIVIPTPLMQEIRQGESKGRIAGEVRVGGPG